MPHTERMAPRGGPGIERKGSKVFQVVDSKGEILSSHSSRAIAEQRAQAIFASLYEAWDWGLLGGDEPEVIAVRAV